MGDHSLGLADEALDDRPATPEPMFYTGADGTTADSKTTSPTANSPANGSNVKTRVPMQKRRRVTRACDECRRKKIKCDGKQPCTHCTVYSYECTYDQPSNRRRNPAPQYIEALEQRLQKAEAILHSVLPGVDLDDPKFAARGVEQIIESSKARMAASKPPAPECARPEDDAQIQSMVERTGTLVVDDNGNWDFHGHSSGYAFMRKFRAQFGDQMLPEPKLSPKNRSISQVLDSPKSQQSSPYEFNVITAADLPSREVAIELCRNTLDDCCALMRPLHQPTFFRRLFDLYETDPEQYHNQHMQFLPLLYVVMGVGCLFSKTEHENTLLGLKGYREALEQGYQYFNTAKHMLDITDCRDLMTIQSIFFMILFLQATAKLATCYAYIGIALRACCRLGLHRNLPNKFHPIEQEERKRMFFLIRKIDGYVGAMLGLPEMLSEEDIDQELPREVDDEYITEEGIRPMPAGSFPLLKATNAHTKLTGILRKVVRHIYPIKGPANVSSGERYSISHRRIRELERDLQAWMDELPMELRPSDNAGRELSRVQQLLRMSYAHVQMMMYRPFIHYVSQACQTRNVDKRSFACAAACVSVARNIVHITTEMKRRGLLVGAYWFVMYTTYFAILSLVFFVLENPDSPTGKDILKDAMEGRDTLASLAKRSMAADRCTVSLAGLFNELPEKLNERRNSMQSASASVRKRPPPVGETAAGGQHQGNHSAPNAATPNSLRESSLISNRARTLPQDFLSKHAKRSSMPEPLPTGGSPGAITLQRPYNPHPLNFSGPAAATSPVSGQFDFIPRPSRAQIPDLKNVMFPSDNPFAYPNQPMSTLESVDAAQYGIPESGMETPFSGSNENGMYGTPSNMHPQAPPQANATQSYDFSAAAHTYDDHGHLAPQLTPGRQFSTPLDDLTDQHGLGIGHNQIFDMPSVHEPMDGGMSGPPQMSQEDYWNQMSKGNVGTRTGFAASAGVNLEDLFGGDGWGGVWNDAHYPRQ